MYDVNKAFEGLNLSAQQQYDFLIEVHKGITKMIQDLKNQSRQCLECKCYYFKHECTKESRIVEKEVCINPLTGGFLSPFEYEKREVEEFYNVCPKGHKIGGYVLWDS